MNKWKVIILLLVATRDSTEARGNGDERGFPESTSDNHLLCGEGAREREQNTSKH